MEQAIWQALVIVLVAGVAIEALLLIAVMRQLDGIIVQLRPARIGEVEHDEGPQIGLNVDVPGLPQGRPAIVVFVSPECSICKPLLPAIPVVARRYPQLEVLAVVAGDDENERNRYAWEIGDLARPDLYELESDWNIPGTPFAVAISGEGRVDARGVVNSLDQLEALAESLTRRGSEVVVADSVSGDRAEEGQNQIAAELMATSGGERVGEER